MRAQRGDARARLPALDLAQEALAQPGSLGDRPQRRPAQVADRSQPLADVDLGGSLRRCRNRVDLAQRNLKRHYWADVTRSTAATAALAL